MAKTYYKTERGHRQAIERHGRVILNGTRYAAVRPGDESHRYGSRARSHIEPEDNELAFDDPAYLGAGGISSLTVR